MKVVTNISEVEDEGMLALIGENVEIFCGIYIYAGMLVGVNDTCVKLQKPHVVFETGNFTDKTYKDAQPMGKEYHYIATGFIESFGVTHKL